MEAKLPSWDDFSQEERTAIQGMDWCSRRTLEAWGIIKPLETVRAEYLDAFKKEFPSSWKQIIDFFGLRFTGARSYLTPREEWSVSFTQVERQLAKQLGEDPPLHLVLSTIINRKIAYVLNRRERPINKETNPIIRRPKGGKSRSSNRSGTK